MRGLLLNGDRSEEANAAIHKAAGVGQPVTQEIAMSVEGDRVECAINGTVLAGYAKAALVTPEKAEVNRRRVRNPFRSQY